MRAEQLANQQAAFEKQQREIAHMHAFVERFRAKATKARQAQSRVKALERMERIAPAHVDSPFRFAFKTPAKNPHPLLSLDRCAAGYAGTTIIDSVRLVLNPGDRVGLLGPNGAGKSTLIKLLAGELSATRGDRIEARHLAIGYFAQHQLAQLHPEHSPLQHLQQLDPQASEQALRDYLGGYGFVGDKALEAVAPFSGGEKSRLVLALLIYRRPNLLLLDEPTNHLDLEMRQALATALQDFDGAMVIVSHDRHLLRVACDQLLLVHGGHVDEFRDELDAYPAWLSRHAGQAIANARGATTVTESRDTAESRKTRKREEAERREAAAATEESGRARRGTAGETAGRATGAGRRTGRRHAVRSSQARERLAELLKRKGEVDRDVEDSELEWLRATDAFETAASSAV